MSTALAPHPPAAVGLPLPAPRQFCHCRPESAAVRWLWDGCLARGQITLLTGAAKLGKTTLLSILLGRLLVGGELAGRRVRGRAAIVLSEERLEAWACRHQRINFGSHLHGYCRPFGGRHNRDQWQAMIERLREHHDQEGLDLMVIDAWPSFASARTEHDANAAQRMLRPLDLLTEAGMAVLILHRPRRPLGVGQSPRGGNGLAAGCDIFMELHALPRIGPQASEPDRRRRLWTWSPHHATPDDVTIELNAEQTDYTLAAHVPDVPQGDNVVERGLAVTIEVLGRLKKYVTRRKILECWPEPQVPNPGTLWRWLDKGVERGQIVCEPPKNGSGAFYYSLPGLTTEWDVNLQDLFES